MGTSISGSSDGPGVPGVKGDTGQFASDGVQGFTHASGHGGVRGVADVEQAAGVIGVSEHQDGVQGYAKHVDHFGVIGINQAGVGVQGQSDGRDGVYGLTHASGHAGVRGITDAQQAAGVIGVSKYQDGVQGYAYGVDHFAVHGINVAGAGVQGWSTGNDGVRGFTKASGKSGVVGWCDDAVAGIGVQGFSHNPNGVGVKGSGHIAGLFEGAVQVIGDISVKGDVILQGADYAEALTTTDPAVEAGYVVVLGEDGEVHPCDREYDSAVAGIVSGAGGVKPAIVLDRHDDSAHVALMGKVWCFADASAAPIRPGDLLTTSSTVGHCRRVTDPGRAFGAVIGKALTPLLGGRGMVRVLVSPR